MYIMLYSFISVLNLIVINPSSVMELKLQLIGREKLASTQ